MSSQGTLGPSAPPLARRSTETPSGRLTWIWRSASAVASKTAISSRPTGLMIHVHGLSSEADETVSVRGGTRTDSTDGAGT